MTDLGDNFSGAHDDSGCEVKLRGVEIFGYSPDNMTETSESSSLNERCSELFKRARNTDAVKVAKSRGYAGDWTPTQKIIGFLGRVTGIHYTR